MNLKQIATLLGIASLVIAPVFSGGILYAKHEDNALKIDKNSQKIDLLDERVDNLSTRVTVLERIVK